MPSSGPESNHDDPHRPHQGRYVPSHPNYRLSREELRELAETTLLKLNQGSYILPGSNEPFDLTPKILHTNEHTTYYSPDDKDISNWSKADLGNNSNGKAKARHTQIAIREYSTLVGARRLHQWLEMHSEYQNRTIGVLNFASAKKPGGGFINGSQAQEESIARASTLYPSLVDPNAAPFYKHYVLNPNDSFYTHAMIYSPSVVLFRNDLGHWMKPIEVDVLTSAAVNAGEIREQVRWEEEVPEIQIDAEMYERIARLLYLFHKRGAKHLILGSFGTGVFQNRISLVAGIFYDLLVGPDAKFKDVFDTVVFAILGGYTVRVFRKTFKDKALDQLEGEDEIVDEVGSEWEGTLSGGIAPEEAIEDGRD
ncbi:hypothetical protein CPC08DRAFT_625469 [Agrocybe pediades]|nr:hypothetical protein CPC08DRAFT_625469 [Agrocybe pediades]